jgi:hypothetical protein
MIIESENNLKNNHSIIVFLYKMDSVYNKLLDDTLKFLLLKNQITGNFEKLEGEFPEYEGGTRLDILKKYMESDLNIEYWKIIPILKHLESENFVYNEYDKNLVLIKCNLSLKGVLFIDNGGYCEVARLQKIAYLKDESEANWQYTGKKS